MRKILLIGPSLDKSPGGMATVIKSQLDNQKNVQGFLLEHLVTHADGGKWGKLYYFLRGLISFIRSTDIQLVHIHVASNASFYRKSVFVYLSRLKGIPVIMHMHGHEFDEFFNRSSSLSKSFIRKTFQKCATVLVLSLYWYDFFYENIVQKNVVILYNGVDIPSLSSCITTADTRNGFLFLGRLGQRKGVYDLLEAINILVNKRNFKDLKFYLAGDGDLMEVETIIKQNKLSDNVVSLGWLDDALKKEYLKKVYTVVLPSYSEGLPMSLLEAMACGKVIISTRVGGIPELIEETTNGFLINPGDINELVENIVHVFTDKAEMENISMNNIKKIQQQYDIKNFHIDLYNIYSKILSEPKGLFNIQ